MASQNQIQTKNMELLRLKTRMTLTVDELVEERRKNEELEKLLAACKIQVSAVVLVLSELLVLLVLVCLFDCFC